MPVAMDNRQCAKLLRDWGFEEAGHSGGHQIMVKRTPAGDKRVQISAVGRATGTPFSALRKAAHIAGVPLHQFLQGPSQDQKAPERVVTPTPVVVSGPEAVEPEAQTLEPEVVAETEEIVAETAKLVCPDCGKDDFSTTRGLAGHRRNHVLYACSKCGRKIPGMGISAHERHCQVNGVAEAEPVAEAKPLAEPVAEPVQVAPAQGAGALATVTVDRNGPVLVSKDDEVRTLVELLFPKGVPLDATTLANLAQLVSLFERLRQQ